MRLKRLPRGRDYPTCTSTLKNFSPTATTSLCVSGREQQRAQVFIIPKVAAVYSSFFSRLKYTVNSECLVENAQRHIPALYTCLMCSSVLWSSNKQWRMFIRAVRAHSKTIDGKKISHVCPFVQAPARRQGVRLLMASPGRQGSDLLIYPAARRQIWEVVRGSRPPQGKDTWQDSYIFVKVSMHWELIQASQER
jgi:hypothetical protein